MPSRRRKRKTAVDARPINSISGKKPLIDSFPKERITQRIGIMLVEHGFWRLNKRFLRPDNVPQDLLAEARRMAQEDGEVVSDRARDDAYFRYEYLDKRKLEVLLRKYAEEQIGAGRAEEVLKRGLVIPSKTKKWKNKDIRVAAIRILVEELAKKTKELTRKDILKNGLGGVLCYYNGSPYGVVREAFPELNIKPWEMKITPNGFFDTEKNRIEAIKWLVKKLKKKPTELTGDDFYKNNLVGMMSNYYRGSPYLAVKEAFPELDIKPWEMHMAPMGFWKKKENRLEAVKWLVEKLGKKSTELTQDDFREGGLGGLLQNYYDSSPYEAVRAVFLERNIKPWQMKTAPMGFWEKEENRVEAVKRLVDKLGMKPTELTKDDFLESGLSGLLVKCDNSPYKAVKESFPELDVKPWQMEKTPQSFWQKKENRAEAVKWLVDTLGKKPTELTQDDFNEYGMRGLLVYAHPYEAVKDAFPELNIKPGDMKNRPVHLEKGKPDK